MEYEIAAAEALYTYRVGNLNPNLEDPERKRLIHSTQNALRVKTHSVRKHYGIAIKPRKTKRAPKQKATETDIDDNSRLPGEGEEQFTSYVTALSKDTSSAEESDEIKDIVSPPYRVILVTQHHRHTAGRQSSLPLSALSKEELPITRDRNEQRRSSSRASYIPVRRPGTVFLYRMGYRLACRKTPTWHSSSFEASFYRRAVGTIKSSLPMRRLEILPLDWGSSTSISTKDGKRQNGLAKTSGLKNAKRTKTLVDFLEEIDLEYTEQQPRRFLGKNKGRGRPQDTFTDDMDSDLVAGDKDIVQRPASTRMQ